MSTSVNIVNIKNKIMFLSVRYRKLVGTMTKLRYMQTLSYVPKFEPYTKVELDNLKMFFLEHEHITVLTGAGVSTESGIPDYRSEDVGLYARSKHRPVQYNEFLKSAYVRQRYWTRNFIGWPQFSSVLPNDVHHLLCQFEKAGKLSSLITQNVDNLHFKAGSKNVIELHGSAYSVICLNCQNILSRHEFQNMLSTMNPNVNTTTSMIRPDGDVEVSEDQISNFKIPCCQKCNGILKTNVIFFGDNVPKQRVLDVQSAIKKGDALLVLGSSLSTFSGYRIILQAKDENKKVAIINIGKTRADKEADIKISTKCGDILQNIARLFNNK